MGKDHLFTKENRHKVPPRGKGRKKQIREICNVILEMKTPDSILELEPFQDLIDEFGGKEKVTSLVGLIHGMKLKAFTGSVAAFNSLMRLSGAFITDKDKRKMKSGYRKPLDEYEDADLVEMAAKMKLDDVIEFTDYEEVEQKALPKAKPAAKKKTTTRKPAMKKAAAAKKTTNGKSKTVKPKATAAKKKASSTKKINTKITNKKVTKRAPRKK